MPGYQTVSLDDLAEFTVHGDTEGRNTVYFTDQHPSFRIEVKNISDGVISGGFAAAIIFDTTGPTNTPEEQYRMSLEEGETNEVIFEPGLLAHQGTAILTVFKGGGFEQCLPEEQPSTMAQPPQAGEPAHTFTVWDRDFYRVNYLRPRWTQYVAAILAILIILVGVLQIYI